MREQPALKASKPMLEKGLFIDSYQNQFANNGKLTTNLFGMKNPE
ncbi:MAG: hypothetical protein VB108_08575 [Anaerolineaceae bacterium]|nr:hypothetical protein [Anaerolineaceae bacterium]